MFCENARPVLVSTIAQMSDGSLQQNTRRVPCRKWTCPQCKEYRQGRLAAHLLTVADYSKPLYVAVVPADRLRTVENAFRRTCGGAEAGAGRVVVGLDGRHLHVANVDCLTPQRITKDKPTWKVRTVSVQEAHNELKDPSMPITRSGRWVGAWKPPAPEPLLLRLTIVFKGPTEREEFTFRYGYESDQFRGSGPVEEGFVDRLAAAWAWWRVNERGDVLDPGTPMLAPMY